MKGLLVLFGGFYVNSEANNDVIFRMLRLLHYVREKVTPWFKIVLDEEINKRMTRFVERMKGQLDKEIDK